MSSTKPTQLTPFGYALAGALGGCFSNAVVYPLDIVKTRIQATTVDTKGENDKEKLSVVSVLLQILKEEGIAGYYRGFTATMINTFSMRESPSISQFNSSMRFVPPASGYTLRDTSYI